MSPAPHGLATLAAVRGFLTEIVPQMPAELSAEVRAAIKLLRTAEIELDDLHLSLRAEADDLIDRCREIGRLLDVPDLAATCTELAGRGRAGGLSLSALGELRDDARDLVASVVADLQQRSDRAASAARREEAALLLSDLYASLGAHARSRLAWQSVFPHPEPAGVATSAAATREDHR